MVAGLGTDVDVAVNDLHVTPDGIDSLGGEETEGLGLTGGQDLSESGTCASQYQSIYRREDAYHQ